MSLQIQIDGDTYLTSDSRQFMISDFKGYDKEGKQKWNNRSFHTSIAGAVKNYARDEAMKAKATSLQELMTILNLFEGTLLSIEGELRQVNLQKCL